MRFEEMLLKRESCRAYAPKPVSREDLLKICEAGRLSPSACNSQPWKFIVADEPEARQRLLDSLLLRKGSADAPWQAGCPAFIVLVEQPAHLMRAAMEYFGDSQYFVQNDVGMACMSMCYQAVELGLSTCVIGMLDQQKTREAMGIPEDRVIRLVLAVGYSAEDAPPREKKRKAAEEVICLNGWN